MKIILLISLLTAMSIDPEGWGFVVSVVCLMVAACCVYVMRMTTEMEGW